VGAVRISVAVLSGKTSNANIRREGETGNLRVSCKVLGNEPGVSVLVEVGERPGISESQGRFWESNREYPYSREFGERDRESPRLFLVSGNDPGISVLVRFGKRPGISVFPEWFLETSREYPCLWKF